MGFVFLVGVIVFAIDMILFIVATSFTFCSKTKDVVDTTDEQDIKNQFPEVDANVDSQTSIE